MKKGPLRWILAIGTGTSMILGLLATTHGVMNWKGLRLQQPPLHAAASDGDLRRVRELIDRGADPNGVDDAGMPPLWYALMNERYVVAERLVKAGASIDLEVTLPTERTSLLRIAEKMAGQRFEDAENRRRAAAAVKWIRARRSKNSPGDA